MAQSTAKKPPKVLDYLLVRPKPKGGHDIEHHYTNPTRHQAEVYTFGEDEGDKAAKHIARHARLNPNLEEPGSTRNQLSHHGRMLRSLSYRPRAGA